MTNQKEQSLFKKFVSFVLVFSMVFSAVIILPASLPTVTAEPVEDAFVFGVVTNQSMGPVAGANVTVHNETYMNWTTTAANGSYVLGVPSGSMNITVNASGYVINTTTIVLGMGLNERNVSLMAMVQPPVTDAFVFGTVLNASNMQEIESANVTIYNMSALYMNYTATTSTGTFSLYSINGTVNLSVSAPGYQVNESQISLTSGANSLGIILLTPAGSPPPGNGSVSGTVKDDQSNPVNNATVGVFADMAAVNAQNPLATNMTNATGDFIIENIPAGTYVVATGVQDVGSAVRENVVVAGGQTTPIGTLVLAPQDGGDTGGEPGMMGNAWINGTVNDSSGNPLEDVMVGAEGEFPMMSMTDSNGTYSLSVMDGEYMAMAQLDGYFFEVNMSITVAEGATAWWNITLDEIPPYDAEVICTITNETGAPVEGAEVMLIDVAHIMGMEPSEASTDENGTANFTTYTGNYTLVTFAPGYYVDFTQVFAAANATTMVNISLSASEPNVVDVAMEFTDLDDATVTVNMTLYGSVPIMKWFIDTFSGNSDGMVSAAEVSSAMSAINASGISFGEMEQQHKEGPSLADEFIALPLELLLDTSQFGVYVPNTHRGSLEGFVGNVSDTPAPAYYNATFNVTLNGAIPNATTHTMNVSADFNPAEGVFSMVVDYGTFYNISNVATTTNMSAQNTLTVLTVQNATIAEAEDLIEYANVTLALNQSTIQLPLYETPVWHVQDRWTYDKAGQGGPSTVTYEVRGKPLREWDSMQYRVNGYDTYAVEVIDDGMFDKESATLADIDWIVQTGENYTMIDDLAFPLYAGKTWQTLLWDGQQANATIVSMNAVAVTPAGTFTCVLINYTDAGALVAQAWYANETKFVVNRTTYDSGPTLNYSMVLTDYMFGSFIEAVGDVVAVDQGNGIETLAIPLTLNITSPGNFEISGSLMKYWEENSPPPQDWRPDIAWAQNSRYFEPGSHTLWMNFSGSRVYQSGQNGPYGVNIELRSQNYWEPLDAREFNYGAGLVYTDFQTPPISIVSYSDFGNDTNGDGLYDYLTVNLTVNVTADGVGQYNIYGGLDKVINRGFWQDWRWVTGFGQDIQFVEGVYNISINYNGMEIYRSGYNGPYKMNIGISTMGTWEEMVRIENNTGTYSATDFTRPMLSFNKTWVDESGQHDFINDARFTVNVSILIAEGALGGGSAWYDLHGGMHIYEGSSVWSEFVSGMGQQYELREGENIVPMNFNAEEIYSALENHGSSTQFIVGMGISEVNYGGSWSPDIANTEYITAEYSLGELPAPSIAITSVTDEIVDGDLVVNVTIAATADGIGSYELNGGVHAVIDQGDWDEWRWITGMGERITITEPGNTTVLLTFSGREISTSGYNGPYSVGIGLNRADTWEHITWQEHWTAAYTTGQFAAAETQINQSTITDYLDGSTFVIRFNVTVSTEGDYSFHGGLHRVDYTFGWGEWRWIAGTGTELMHLTAGNHTIYLNFSAREIRSMLEQEGFTQNESFQAWIGVNDQNWMPITNAEYQTTPYSYTEFPGAGVTLTGITDSISGDGDLVINLTLDVDSGGVGTYQFHSGLHWIDTASGWEDWRFITSGYNMTALSEGTNYVELVYPGREIYNSEQNGPYKTWIGIETFNSGMWERVTERQYDTAAYSYGDFSAPTVRLVRENMTAGAADFLNDTLLTINVTVIVGSGGAGFYHLNGGLNYIVNRGSWEEWRWVSGTGTPMMYLSEGTHTIPLNFNGKELRTKLEDANYNGTLRAWININQADTWQDVDHLEYTTNSYSYSDFPIPGIRINRAAMADGVADYINTSNGDYLTVNVTLDVGVGASGMYDLHGGVNYIINNYGWDEWHHLTGTGNWFEIPESAEGGQITVPLNFNAGEISSNLPDGYSDALRVWIGLSDPASWQEITNMEYTTQSYAKSDFPGPGIRILGMAPGSADYINGSYLTVNLTVNVTAGSVGDYHINAGLHSVDTSRGWEEWRWITGYWNETSLVEGEYTIPVNFKASDINTSGQNGPYRLWIGVNDQSTWQEVAHTDYTTQPYTAGDFQGPSIRIVSVDDFKNGTALTINVTINATTSGTFHLHGGLNYIIQNPGWEEWRWIAGTGQDVAITAGEKNYSITFSGQTIYASGQNGPYRAWIGINDQSTWEEVTHTEHTTAAYNYEDFPAPGASLVRAQMSDFANDTNGDGQADYLTVNVSLDVSEAGDYVVEGGLHYRLSDFDQRWITWAQNTTALDTGSQNVSLNFNGNEIYSRLIEEGVDPATAVQFESWVNVRNGTTWEEIAHIDPPYRTQNTYAANDFTLPAVQFNTTMEDSALENNTNGYDWLIVNLTLDVSSAGTYEVNSILVDPATGKRIAGTEKATAFETGDNQQVRLWFNGTKINASEVNGPYKVFARVIDSTGFELDKIDGTTGAYNYSDFEGIPKPARLNGTYSDYNNSGNLTINVTVNVTTTGTYEVFGDLFNNATGTWLASSYNLSVLSAGDQVVQLTFAGSALGTGPYKLGFVRLSESGATDEIESVTNAYVTTTTEVS